MPPTHIKREKNCHWKSSDTPIHLVMERNFSYGFSLRSSYTCTGRCWIIKRLLFFITCTYHVEVTPYSRVPHTIIITGSAVRIRVGVLTYSLLLYPSRRKTHYISSPMAATLRHMPVPRSPSLGMYVWPPWAHQFLIEEDKKWPLRIMRLMRDPSR
jgi:hypothetical protein